jgi:hypothetical protein
MQVSATGSQLPLQQSPLTAHVFVVVVQHAFAMQL